MANPTLQRSAAAPSGARASSGTVSNLLANYGLLFVFLLIMLVFGLLRPSSFFSATNLNAILVSQSVTAILALAAMVPLATKQFDLSIGYHLGLAQVLIVGLQVTQGLAMAFGGGADPARVPAGRLRQRPSGDVFPYRFVHRHHGHGDAALRRHQLVHERRTDSRHEFAGQFHRPDPDRPWRPACRPSMSRSLQWRCGS